MHAVYTEPEEGPPYSPVGEGGLTHAQGPHVAQESRSGHTKMRKICWSPGLRPGPRWGSLQRSPRPSWWGGGFAAPSPRTPLTILSLCLSCVYVHTCMKMHYYFLWNVKHGASQLYWGASKYLAPALHTTPIFQFHPSVHAESRTDLLGSIRSWFLLYMYSECFI